MYITVTKTDQSGQLTLVRSGPITVTPLEGSASPFFNTRSRTGGPFGGRG